jgi:hypothetical protein
MRWGSWSQSSFRTEATGTGTTPTGIVTMGLPGPIPAGCHQVIKDCSEMREGVAEQKIFQDGKICGGAHHHLICCCKVPNGCTQSILRPKMYRRGVGVPGWGIVRDSESSVQSKHGGAGIEHSSIVLRGGQQETGAMKW